VHRADQAMYRVKQTQRDGVAAAPAAPRTAERAQTLTAGVSSDT
jgi:hypothetical protein